MFIYLIGHYAFIESSRPRVKGDKAWLQSPKINPTTRKCLHFWYHMLGSGIGSLNVVVRTATTNKTVWSLSGAQQTNTQQNMWFSAQVNVAMPNTPFYVSHCEIVNNCMNVRAVMVVIVW
jgi:hypothetical protein